MRTRLVVPTLLIVLLAACGSSSGATSSPGAQATASSAASSQTAASQPTASTVPAGNGKVDCTAIKTAAQELLMVQLLAQLRSADTVEAIRTKQVGNLDLDAFLAAMHELHALDGYSSALGDPKAAIDVYEQAGRAAQVLFATEPMTQAAIDTYNQGIGTVGDFILHQGAISGAMEAAGCG